MRAEARAIGALLAERGDERRAEEAEAVKLDMARVVVGEGPEPWMVDTRGEDGVRRWGVVDDANVNMTRLEEWSHAARYALPITCREFKSGARRYADRQGNGRLGGRAGAGRRARLRGA